MLVHEKKEKKGKEEKRIKIVNGAQTIPSPLHVAFAYLRQQSDESHKNFALEMLLPYPQKIDGRMIAESNHPTFY